MPVYFIQVGADGPIKIGYSLRPEERVKAIQADMPWPIHLIGCVPGNPATERIIHVFFAAHRIRGEWFHPHPDVLAMSRNLLAALELPQPKRARHYTAWGNAHVARVRDDQRAAGVRLARPLRIIAA